MSWMRSPTAMVGLNAGPAVRVMVRAAGSMSTVTSSAALRRYDTSLRSAAASVTRSWSVMVIDTDTTRVSALKASAGGLSPVRLRVSWLPLTAVTTYGPLFPAWLPSTKICLPTV